MGANVKADPAPSLYDIDFFKWTASAARELRGGRASRADVELIAQEIEDMGKRDAREVWNRTETLLMHLLKWVAQPQERSRSWSGTIARERRRLERLLKDSPSLRRKLESEFVDVYSGSAKFAAAETGLARDVFPQACPFTLERVLDHDFWPENFS